LQSYPVTPEGKAVKNLWESDARQEISHRLDRLRPDAVAVWGRMNARQMMAHVVDALRMAIGDLKAEERKLPIRFAPLKQLIIYGPPFPKNSPTAPELKGRQADDWEAECAKLRELMETFASRPRDTVLPRHPAFGKLSRRAWGALSYKHLDHHLRQFGV
jgi:hypothetical protein